MTAKKFINQVSLLFILNLVVKLVWVFFVERNIQLKVGFAQYGMYYSIFSFTLVLSVIADPGLSNFMMKRMGVDKTENRHFSFLSLKLILSLAYLIFTISTAYLLNYVHQQLLWVLVAYQILWSFLIYLRSYLKINQLFFLDAFISVLDKFLLVLVLIPVLAFADDFSWTTLFYAYSQLITLLIALMVCLIVLYRNKIEVFKSFKLKFDLTLLKPLMPFAIFSFLVLALQKIDSLMLEKLALNGAVETGIYGAAYRFLEAATMLPILFATFFYPLMVNLLAQQKKFNHLVNNGLKLLGAFSIVLALTSWFYQTQLITLFYGNEKHQNLDLVFGLLMFTVFFQSVYYVYSSVFTANNNLKLLCYISLAGLGVNIIANIILIPLYSAVGAAISNLLGFGVMALIYVISYHIKFNFKIAYSIWFKFLVLILTLCTSRLFLDQLSLNLILHLLLFLTVGLFTAFLLKLLSIKDFS